MLISEKDKLLVSNTIKELEKSSSGEIVPVLASKSSKYLFFRFMYASIFTYLILFIYFYFIKENLNFALDLDIFGLIVGLISFYVFYSLSNFNLVLKYLIPKKVKKYKCEKQAYFEFFQNEVYKTRDNTGILIYISVLERQVVVIGDWGINSKIDNKEWDNLIKIIVKSIKEKNITQGIVEGLIATNDLLKNNFPIKPDDTNELSNELIIK